MPGTELQMPWVLHTQFLCGELNTIHVAANALELLPGAVGC